MDFLPAGLGFPRGTTGAGSALSARVDAGKFLIRPRAGVLRPITLQTRDFLRSRSVHLLPCSPSSIGRQQGRNSCSRSDAPQERHEQPSATAPDLTRRRPTVMGQSPDIQYVVLGRPSVEHHLLQDCAALFNASYAKWGAMCGDESRVGQSVKFTPGRLRQAMLFDEQCFVSLAQTDDQIVGYAFFRRFPYLSGEAVWITQLVVAPAHRSRGIAAQLVSTSLSAGRETPVAVGIITSHPHAVRCLERATGKPVLPSVIGVHGSDMMAASHVPYLDELRIQGCTVDSKFFTDHTEVLSILESQSNWRLGHLQEGHEFVAVVLLDRESPA